MVVVVIATVRVVVIIDVAIVVHPLPLFLCPILTALMCTEQAGEMQFRLAEVTFGNGRLHYYLNTFHFKVLWHSVDGVTCADQPCFGNVHYVQAIFM